MSQDIKKGAGKMHPGRISAGYSKTGKKAYNQNMKRSNIQQAAKILFLEKKYSTITVDEIARQAGVTKRTLYFYYPSKLALFVHVIDEHLQQLHQHITRKARQNLPVLEVLAHVALAFFEFTKNNQKFMRLYWTLDSEEFDGVIPAELLERIKIWTKAIFEEVGKIIEKGKRDGLISDLDTDLLIHLMSAMNKGIFMHTSKENRFNIAKIDPEELYQMVSQILFNGLFKQT
ncbi:MAG TPA: TetR/AcrR family transcriptional regulator [Syntrophorhabdaceae bacterium]|nr:TetR/AcrR family transcriptional regulator [Syntrophorhabdaceae bacterium]HPA07258.1 TetR/AcrR family transcriptional regulator [Methanoregulaceae archaeon]